MTYNYDEFSPSQYDFESADGPDVGDTAPDFTLSTSDGDQRNLLDFDGDFLVLELGSITCPLFQSRRPRMETLTTEFDNVDSVVLYVREAHPGVLIPTHATYEDKTACATRLKEEDGETRTVLVDTIDGDAHKAYGSMPNAVYIIDQQGRVRFKSPWNNARATHKALAALTQGRAPDVKSYFKPALPTVTHRTLKNGGEGSGKDFYKGLPSLIPTNLRYNLRVLLGRDR
ncbi:MAG: deiodinase-like protein [Actinomycetota bacterium]